VRGAGGTSSNEFSIQTDFGVRITPLTNRVAIRATNTAPILQEYYSYQVPTSNVLGVTFTVSGATGDVDLYAIRAPNLPGTGRFDYASATPGVTNETLVIHLDSQPVPLAPGLWYLAVTNTSGIPGTSYAISVIEQRGRIQELKPGQSITADHPGVDEDFYYVTLPTDVSALRVRTRGATEDLILSSRSKLPVPTAINFEYQSDTADSGDEDILVTTNSTPVALAGGRWYFAVTSVGGLPTPYTISADLRLRDAVFEALTNEIWFEAVATNGPVDLEFIYRNPGDVSAITFELDQLTGEADLAVSPDEPLPLSPVLFANAQPGTQSEQVTVLAGRDLPSLGRDWYLRVRLPSAGPVRFRIRASLNRPPVWTPVGTRRVTEGLRLTFNLRATDPDPFPQLITYGLVQGPVGLTVSTNGVVTWQPSEAQGPSTNLVLVFASDGAVSATNQFEILVREQNLPPVWTNPGTRRVIEGLQWTYALKVSDADLPVQPLQFTLVSGPEGLTMDTNGVLNWQPSEAQGPSTNRVTVSVSDGSVSVPQEFDVVVLESNRLPSWVTLVTTRRVSEGALLTFTVQATDTDLPAQRLTYRLVTGPTGMVVTTNGVVSWRPTEAQGPSTNRVRIGVSDGVAGISQEFDVLVFEQNQAPVWTDPGTRRVSEGLQLTFTLKASDADLPAQTLKFGLEQGPAGLTVSTNGVLSWRPTAAQGPSTNRVQVSVSDGVVSVSQQFTIVVNEPPVVAAQLTLVQIAGVGYEIRFVGPFGAQYILEQGPSVLGPWVPVPEVLKPLTAAGMTVPLKIALPASTGTNNFYRFVKP
jgi:hypothetical protein